ncbi:MAG: hypothetical protein JNN17_26345 [Verrucomicrobiaceae bacterium]|nr:hypothetical protein [Verrucomicrobiaceae bacterium]
MKRVKTMILIWLGVLVCFLTPWHTWTVGAYPENLWTKAGQWQKPADPNRLFRCVRQEHGLMLSWLVYDRGNDQDAWYVRIDYRILVVFAMSAFLTSIILCRFLTSRT